MKRSWLIGALLCSFLLGVAFETLFSLLSFWIFSLSLTLLGCGLLFCPTWRFFLGMGGCFLLGAGRVLLSSFLFLQDPLPHFVDTPHTFLATVCAPPDMRLRATKITACVSGYQDASGKFLSTRGKSLLTLPHYSTLVYGDTFLFQGTLSLPLPIEGFDYASYLRKDGIGTLSYYPRITFLAPPSSASLIGIFSSLRLFMERRIMSLWQEPTSSFMAGLLLGSRKGIPEDLLEAFRITGLTHLIAISGFNITLIITFLSGMFRPLPPFLRFLISGVGVIAFTLFVGASPPVVRACIMGLLGLLALYFGRSTLILLVILWSGVLMVLWNPFILLYDAGFQLSFLALLGLVFFEPPLSRLLARIPSRFGLKEALLSTIAAQISTTPLLLTLFRQLSLIAPLANLLVTPFIPFIMLLGFVCLLCSFLHPALGFVLAFLPHLLLSSLTKSIFLLAQLPYASFPLSFSPLLSLSIYGIVLITLLFPHTPWRVVICHRWYHHRLIMVAFPHQNRRSPIQLFKKHHTNELMGHGHF